MRHWKIPTWHAVLCSLVLAALLPVPARADHVEPTAAEDLLPFVYARIWDKEVAVFSAPGDPSLMVPDQHLLPPDSWVSIDKEVEADGRLWYQIADGAFVLASDVVLSPPSLFHGEHVEGELQYPVGFVATRNLNVRARPGAGADNPPLTTLPQYSVVSIMGREDTSEGMWYQIDQDRYVHGAYTRVVYPVARPDKVAPDDRWIAVDLAQQTLSAYEGDRMVFATLISSGRPPWYTPKGLSRIWIKLQAGDMEGGEVERGDYYYLQDVPWTMYFSRDVGLHAAYWHDSFGIPRSHGCVNLSPLDAKWLFDWASPLLHWPNQPHVYGSKTNPGTWVYVYSSG